MKSCALAVTSLAVLLSACVDPLADCPLPGQVNCLVPRHDDMQVTVDHQLLVILEVASFFKALDLSKEDFRVEHDTVTDHATFARVQDAGRDQVEHGFLTVDHQCMARIVATLKTHYSTDLLGQQVDHALEALFFTPWQLDGHEGRIRALRAYPKTS